MTAVITAFPALGFDEPSSEVRAGLSNLEKGLLEEAEAALSRARFKAPEDSRILYDLGIVAYRKRDYQGAAKTWERSGQASDPDLQADSLHNLGNARYRSHNWSEAVTAYEQALGVREDPLTRFNLEQARKRLQEEQEQQQREQQQQPQDGQPQDGQQKNGQQQNGQQQNGKQADGQKQSGQQSTPDQKQRQPGEQDKTSGQENQGQGGEQKQPDGQAGKDPASQPKGQTGASDTADPGRIGSATPEMGSDQRERKDLAMKEGEGAPPPPKDVSEAAKAMKEKRINPFLVERVLKELEQREREIQLRYRQDPSQSRREEEMDPLMMDPEQLQRFFQRRGRPQPKPDQDSPDW